jgi:hypothetical protein
MLSVFDEGPMSWKLGVEVGIFEGGGKINIRTWRTGLGAKKKGR